MTFIFVLLLIIKASHDVYQSSKICLSLDDVVASYLVKGRCILFREI